MGPGGSNGKMRGKAAVRNDSAPLHIVRLNRDRVLTGLIVRLVSDAEIEIARHRKKLVLDIADVVDLKPIRRQQLLKRLPVALVKMITKINQRASHFFQLFAVFQSTW